VGQCHQAWLVFPPDHVRFGSLVDLRSYRPPAGYGSLEVCGLNVVYYSLARPTPASGDHASLALVP